MAEACCPYGFCSGYRVQGPNLDELIDKVVEHMIASHRGFIQGDVLEHKFVKCPVCGGEVNKPVYKCPKCGADLVRQRALAVAKMYAKG
jgi:predicted small metal-binding protein